MGEQETVGQAPGKPCRTCKQVKELACFYKHPRMADWHRSDCKDCFRKKSARNLHKKPPPAYERKIEPPRFDNGQEMRWKLQDATETYCTRPEIRRTKCLYNAARLPGVKGHLACHWHFAHESALDVVHVPRDVWVHSKRFLQYDHWRQMYRTKHKFRGLFAGTLLETKAMFEDYVWFCWDFHAWGSHKNPILILGDAPFARDVPGL